MPKRKNTTLPIFLLLFAALLYPCQEVLSQPSDFWVYLDKNASVNHYIPSGWMGDIGDISMNEGSTNNPHSGATCLQFTYSAKKSQGQGWAGVYWQNPLNNWGSQNGGYDLRGMNKLTFWARGEKGGEVIQKAIVGGITGAYPDSTYIRTGSIHLTSSWNQYTIDLTGQDLAYISGGFCWVTTATLNPNGATFYLDDIKFEPDTTPPATPTINSVTTPTTSKSQAISGARTADASVISIACSTASVGSVTYPSATTWSCSITGLSEGSNTITVKGIDAAGNQSAPATATIIVDTTAPTGSIQINGGAGYVSSISVTLSLSATDSGSGMGNGAQMQFSNNNSTWSAPQAYAASAAWVLTSGDGSKTVYAKFKDAIGNWSAVASGSIILDTAAPAGTVKINNASPYTNSTVVTLNLSATDSGSGMGSGAQMQFSNDNATWSNPQAYAVAAAWTLASTDGTKTVYAKFKDAAGKWSPASTDSIILDATPPTGVISINKNASLTNSLQVNLALSATDKSSGVSQMQFSNDNTSWSAAEAYNTAKSWTLLPPDGKKTVYSRFKDNAGNWSAAVSSSINLNTGGPIITNVRPANLTVSSATILWDTDEPSTGQVEYGLTNTYGSRSTLLAALVTSHSIALSGLKAYTKYHYRVISKDSSGNQALSGDYTFTTKDTTIPKGSILINGGALYANSVNVTLTLNATDAQSGITRMQFSSNNKNWSAFEPYATTKAWVLTSGDGLKYVYARFKDGSGNISAACYDSITLNTKPPQITAITPKDGSSFYENATIPISQTVNTTGILSVEYQFSIDGVVKQPWSTYSSYIWLNPAPGLHNIKAEVRGQTGQAAKQAQVCVYRNPVGPQ